MDGIESDNRDGTKESMADVDEGLKSWVSSVFEIIKNL